MMLLPLILIAAQPLSLEAALDLAGRQTAGVIRAQADLLLVDIDKARAISNILPSVGLSMTGGEAVLGSPIVEGRTACYRAEDNSGPCISPVAGGSYRLTYGPYYDATVVPNSAPLFTLGLSVRQLIFDGGRWWALLERNGDIRQQQQWAFKTVRDNARLNALRAFYNLVKAKEGVKAAKVQVRLSTAQLERARKASAEEVATAERNLASDELNLAQRNYTAGSFERALNLAMGVPPEEPVELVIPLAVASATASVPRLTLPSAETLLGMALEGRPELLQSRASRRIVEANISIRRADHYPVVALNGSYTRITRRPDRLFSDPTQDFYGSVGLSLSWNVFTGGAISANVEEGEIELGRANANYADLERAVKAEVLDRLERLKILLSVHRLGLAAAESAARARQLVDARAKEGGASSLELRDAELRYTQATLQAIEGRIDIEVGRAELVRAVGVDVPLDGEVGVSTGSSP
ncbi:MAG: TolC family protein [Myxococcota bacterium]